MLQRIFDARKYFESPDEDEQAANDKLDAWKAAPFRWKLQRQHDWKKAVCVAVYSTTDPGDIPYEDLKLITSLSTDDAMRPKYAERIKNPVTGIRAFCFNCQGNDISGVRNCTNVVCPLFPFRMGKNVFSGKLADADAAPAEDIEEIEEA